MTIIYVGIRCFKNTYNQYDEHEYHVLNIKEFEWGTPQRRSKYYNTLFNLETKEAIFCLVCRACKVMLVRTKRKLLTKRFVNINDESSFSIVLKNSKFMNKYY